MSAAPNDLKLADLTLRKRKVKKRTKRSTLVNSGGSERTERADNENVRREEEEDSHQNISGK